MKYLHANNSFVLFTVLFTVKTAFLPNERIQQVTRYVGDQCLYFLIISLIIVVNIRLPRKLVQYRGFSPRAMINERVCF